LDEVGVAYHFQDVDLAGDALYVGDVDYLLFLEDFHGDFLLGAFVDGEFDFAEGALAEGFFWVGGGVPTRYSPMRLVSGLTSLINKTGV
jgi:hypothetical protein